MLGIYTIILGYFTAHYFVTATEMEIPFGYQQELPPSIEGSRKAPMVVKVSMNLLSILHIDESKSEMELTVSYRVFWNDSRLTQLNDENNLHVLAPFIRVHLWRPDVLIENVRSVVPLGVMHPNVLTAKYKRPYPSQLEDHARTVVTVGCQFDYAAYPLDVQVCPLQVGTVGSTKAEIDLRWHEEHGFHVHRKHFLRYHDLFRLKVCEDVNKPFRKSRLGSHPQKVIIIILERDFYSALAQVYVPSTVFITTAWLSVLVPPTMMRTRLLLNCTNLLTLVVSFLFVTSIETEKLTKVDYLTALHLWMLVCVGFCSSSVLLVVFDMRLIAILSRPRKKLKKVTSFRDVFRPRNTSLAKADDDDDDNSGSGESSESESSEDDNVNASRGGSNEFHDATDAPDVPDLTPSELHNKVETKRLNWLSKTGRMERIYFILYPILFIAFVILYFIIYVQLRQSSLRKILDRTGGKGQFHSGCWCLPGDTTKACMKSSEYGKIN